MAEQERRCRKRGCGLSGERGAALTKTAAATATEEGGVKEDTPAAWLASKAAGCASWYAENRSHDR